MFVPNELHVYAGRGPLQLLYRGETETIAEGEAYRVLLDPSDGDANKKGAVKAARLQKAFLLIAITGAVAGAATAAALHENHGAQEDGKPGPGVIRTAPSTLPPFADQGRQRIK